MPDLESKLRAYAVRLDERYPDVTLDELTASPHAERSDQLAGPIDLASVVSAERARAVTLSDAEPTSGTSNRRRVLIAAAAVVVVIGVAGFALATTNGDDQSPAPVATVSVAPTTNVAPTETVAPVSQEWRLSSAEIDPRAAELDIKIVVVMPDELVEYDTGSGERASIPIQLPGGGPPSSLEAGQDWIRLGPPWSAAVDLYQGSDSPVRIPGSDFTVRQPGTDMFWAVEGWHPFGPGPDNPEPQRVHETDFAGNETGVSFDLGPNEFGMTDPAGGLVVQAPDGGTYQLDPETGASRLITTGELIALNAQTALVADCGDESVSVASCGLVVLDRLTGESHPLTPDHMPQYLQFRGEISPNNRYAPVNYRNGILGVIDLTTGETTYLQAAGGWWSPDGSRLVYVRDPSTSMGPIDQPIPSGSDQEDTARRLLMYDFDDDAEIPIVPDSDGLIAFAVRT